ncbi:MAG: DivIVA domain-containing protein [Butyricicoccaceae bacterium]
MLSIEEIQSAEFEKAVFGGYDCKSVDYFLEDVLESYAALLKQNAEAKSALQAANAKLEEYRAMEASIRQALITAQSASVELVDKAQKQAAEILSGARAQADDLLENARRENQAALEQYQNCIAQEEARLKQARDTCAVFLTNITACFQGEIEKMDLLAAAVGTYEQTAPAQPEQTDVLDLAQAARPSAVSAPRAYEPEDSGTVVYGKP